MTPVIG